MPRDFLMKDTSSKNYQERSPRDFLSQPEKESLSESILYAVPRIGEDILNSAFNFAQNIPSYYESAKTEIPGIFTTARKNPKSLAFQGLAGANEMVNTLAQLPKNIAEYGSNRLNLLPQEVPKIIGKITPEDTTQSINNLFGEPKNPGEALLRGGIRNIPNLLATKAITSKLNPMQLTSENIAKSIIEAKRKNKELYGEKYSDLFKKAENEGYGWQIKNPAIDIKSIRKYSPSKKIEAVEDFMKNPSAETAHFAKSDLKAIQRGLDKEGTLNTAQRKQYKAVNDAIGYIDEHILTNKLGVRSPELKEKYRDINTGYRKEVVPYTTNSNIQKYGAGKKTAKELIPSLKKGEFAAQRGTFKHHPALILQDALKKALIAAGIGGAGFTGGKALYDYLSKSE